MAKAACIFCEIVAGTIPAYVVLDAPHAVAFLDHRPLFPGHVLLVPREHFAVLTDVPPALLGPLFESAQHLARAVEAALGAEGTFVAMNNRVSQSVAHLHVHVVPRRRKDGLKGFFWPRNPYRSDAEMEETRAAIVEALGG
ncbi:HIT family protein [Chondromyces apiculatus]|uniref:Bis(5'-nucleosyl)-tetraphosphatase n=1 Tax=Chondromyces apiculatus DSM 436 TaxID=1192034 RepID=A0A017SYG0_9BACT|nr:HIT family protein [Chondromyces apiculatus]EYF01988.1 Bis(5'-nucleosyl)-tetraphosphatase [Chondromyces apiculatus DSM 436]